MHCCAKFEVSMVNNSLPYITLSTDINVQKLKFRSYRPKYVSTNISAKYAILKILSYKCSHMPIKVLLCCAKFIYGE